MLRSGPMKRTPLKRTKGLDRGKPLKRVAFTLRRKPMRARAKPESDLWRKNRATILERFPRCEVPGCTRRSSVVHHLRNGGKGYRDHSLGNLVALCAKHHTGEEGVHVLGRETWARRFWAVSFLDLAVMVTDTRDGHGRR